MCLSTIVIIIIIIVIVSAFKQHNTPEKKVSNYEQLVQQLANVSYSAREMSGIEKAANLWPSDEYLLQSFSYSNGTVSLTMKNGYVFTAPIRQLNARFYVQKGENYTAELWYGNQKLNIYTYWHLFSGEEWCSIFAYLSYSGTTYGAAQLSDFNRKVRNVTGKVNTGLKVLKFFMEH